MTAPNDTLTDLHWAVLEKLDSGERPEIPPLMRKKLHRLGLIDPAEPKHDPRTHPGRVPQPRARRNDITAEGRRRVRERRARIAEQTRHDVAASVARHGHIDELIERSSIGMGLREIREQGIDAHLERLDHELHGRGAKP